MEQEKIVPFSEVLDDLFEKDPLPIHLLYRLSDLREREYAAFAERWPSVSDERRRVIVRHLADLTEDDFVVDFTPIFLLCFHDSVAAIRVAALEGLWDLSDIRHVPALLELMVADKDLDVRIAATGVLGQFVLLAEWGQVPRHIGPNIVDEMLGIYDYPETSIPLRQALLEAMGASDNPRIPALIRQAYEDIDERLQVSALFAMGNSADRQWVPIVLREMSSENEVMRLQAARAAGLIGSSDAVDHLDKLTEDENDEIRYQAIISLGQIGGGSAEEILIRLSNDADYEEYDDAISDALEEMALFSGEFEFLDYTADELEDDE